MNNLSIFVVIAAVGASLALYGMSSPKGNSIGYACQNESAAFEAAQELAVDLLRAPSTAKFQRFDHARVVSSGCSFTILSHVDAQNGFGASIRNNFAAEVTVDQGTREYVVKSFTMHGR